VSILTVNTIAARNAIASGDRTDGMAVHVLEVGGVFHLRGGTTNTYWEGPYHWETSADMEIYVNGGTGNDATGTGAVGAPYATITRAYKDVPYVLRHAVQIHIATGTYTDWPDLVDNKIEGDGQLVFDGMDGLSDDEGTLTSGTTTVVASAWSGYIAYEATVQVTGSPGWSANEHRGKFIKVLTGANAGGIAAITGNTADTLSVFAGNATLPDTGDTFTVGVPLAVVNVSTSKKFHVEIDAFNRNTNVDSGFGIGFISINTSENNESFVFRNTNILLQASRLISSTVNPTVYCSNTLFNTGGMKQPTKSFTVSSTINTYDTCWFYRGYVYLDCSDISAAVYYVRGEFRSSFTTGKSGAFKCRAQKLEFWNPITFLATGCVFEGGTSYECIDIRYTTEVHISECYFKSGKSIVYVREEGVVGYSSNTQAAAANFTRYGIEIDGLARIIIAAGDPPAGNLGDIYFYQTDTISPAPATGAAVTDDQGSVVVNRRA
jgi:hypothetical protein